VKNGHRRLWRYSRHAAVPIPVKHAVTNHGDRGDWSAHGRFFAVFGTRPNCCSTPPHSVCPIRM
jgi:hypothetical protein